MLEGRLTVATALLGIYLTLALIMNKLFLKYLLDNGWVESGPFSFNKKNFSIMVDTGSWLELSADNKRFKDVAMPNDLNYKTIYSEIERLFEKHDFNKKGLKKL